MNFEVYEEFIKEHKFDMMSFIIYYNLRCSYESIKEMRITDEKREVVETLIRFIYKAYMKDESHIDLGHITDKAVKNIDKILNDKYYTTWDLLGECY